MYADPSLTVTNICTVFSLVTEKDWKKVWSWGVLLHNFMIESNTYRASSLAKGNEICAEDYIKYNPMASWQHLAAILYENEETAALQLLKQFLPVRKGTFSILQICGIIMVIDGNSLHFIFVPYTMSQYAGYNVMPDNNTVESG